MCNTVFPRNRISFEGRDGYSIFSQVIPHYVHFFIEMITVPLAKCRDFTDKELKTSVSLHLN